MIRDCITLRTSLLGLTSWAIPFFAAFAFYGPDGQLAVDIFLFKTVMMVLGALSGALLLLAAFRRVPARSAEGLVLGVYWFALNGVLDLSVLVGAMGMDAGAWFTGIGLRYLVIPIMAAAMGALAQRGQ